MEQMIEFCHKVFDQSAVAFAIARVHLDESGTSAVDFRYEYLNAAAGALTDQRPEDLLGRDAYAVWPEGDTSWLSRLYRVAYLGETLEFETVSDSYGRFLRTSMLPVDHGMCALLMHDVSEWVEPMRPSLENAEAGVLFYDMDSHLVQIPATTSGRFGLRRTYEGIVSFCEENFGAACVDDVRRQVVDFRDAGGSILYEGQLADGRWLRISLAHAGRPGMFAFGFVEDITRSKQLEEANARRMGIIDSLGRENYALYLADLAQNTMEPYRIRKSAPDTARYMLAESSHYQEGLETYIDTYVHPADRERVRAVLLMPHVRQQLKALGGEVSVTYRRILEDDTDYMQMRVLSLADGSDEVVMAARDVSAETREQMRQKALLQDALTLAQNASNAKSAFLANMSHDIRTPMNAITGFASIALGHMDETARVQDCLEKILASSSHLLNLINDILDMSRIESGKVEINEEPLSLRGLADELRDLFQGQAAERGLSLSIDFSAIHDDEVLGDPLRLSQILVNLIGNAVKFTEPGGAVAVRGWQRQGAPTGYGSYALSVKDTGRGMSPEFLDRIFEPFEREVPDNVPKVEGTGLGMPITKNLVDMMGGRIAITSAPGEGSEFVVELDLRLPDGASEHASTRHWSSRAVRRDPARFRGKRVLVADDDDLSREIMQAILQEQGLVVDAAEDGDAAVEMVAAAEPFTYDALLMDMHMPHLGGTEATRAIRALERDDVGALPIIAVTADAFEEDRRAAMAAGMTAHVSKPLDLPRLIALLDELL